MDHTAGRVEWRYISLEHGELLVMTMQAVMMLKLCADNLDMILDVCKHICIVNLHHYLLPPF